ncbi:hypothetical protein RN001_004105 [Aquatica leii]|uniref:PLAT domain-containing protein n=1 Tax=Aquatica leii TaxID=1421715 RepID=A0AAN7SMM7_9COLE|nr:hypothetical protein RN001_004105 [Aquatica leii]
MPGECSISPKSGTSFVTLFTIVCSNVSHTQPVTFSLYQVSNTDLLLATTDSGEFEVYLPTGTKSLYIKISDPDNLYIIKNVAVQVDPFINQIPEEDKIQTLTQKYDDMIPNALKTGNAEVIVQMMNMIASEAKLITDDKFKKKLKLKILGDLEKIPLQTQNDIAQVASLNRNLWDIQTEHDRSFRRTSVEFSQKAAKYQLKLINQAPFPDKLDLDVINTLPDLLWVANQSLEAFPSETVVQDFTFIVTTPTDMLTFPVVSEFYVDYKDADLDYLSRIRDYKHATKSAINVFTLAGLATAKTLTPGEPVSNVIDNVLQAITDGPRALARTKLGVSDAQVIGSQSLTDISDYLHGVVSVYPDNPYWWHKDDINISTKILNANYFHKDKLLGNIKYPLQLFFAGNWIDPIHKQGVITIPSKTNNTELDQYVAVHRVDVKQGGALIVDFYDVKEALNIVMTYNRKPRLSDFNSSSISVTEKSTHVFYPRKDLIDFGNCWFYIGILPNKTQTPSEANLTINYEISFVTIICSYWSNSFEKWISSDCYTGKKSNNTHIHCFCTHHSSYAGSYLNAPSVLDPYKKIVFTLKIHTSSVIFIFVAVALLTYCVLLVDDYYYLIVVKTSSRSSSGTTSNIGLQIMGSMANSRKHLINFPDPYTKLLQRSNKDQFVLATCGRLGELNCIWLWFDSVGTRPSWHCEWITITDLQNNDKWYFEIRALFSVLDGGYCKLLIKPSVSNEPKTWTSVFNNHNWNFTTLRKNRLSYVVRLTIILSTILTTSSVTLVLYGVPKFRRSDGFGYGHYQISTKIVFLSFLSSLVSFFANLYFVTTFKNRLIFFVTFNLTFLVVFGFWMPYVDALLWLTSTFGALILIVVFFETTYIILTKSCDQDDVFVNTEEILIQAKEQKNILTENFGKELLRPLFIHKYRSLTVEEWKIKKEKELIRRRVAVLIQDLIMFGVYIILLFFIVLANRDASIVFSNKRITELLVTEKFEEILSLADVYEYLNDTLIDIMHSINWYGSWNALQPGLLSDYSSKILGVGRIRQQRVCKECCTVPKYFQNFSFKCMPEYSWLSNVKDEFMEFWNPVEFVAVPRLATAWKYTYDAMSAFDYFDLIRVEYLLTVMAALLICVATVRLWKLLRFIPDFQIFEQTILRSGKLLLGLAICHWLIWCMYTILGSILFGTQLHYFHNAHATLTTLMLLSMNLYSAFDYNALIHVGGVYAYLYFASYAIVMLTIYSFYVSLLMIYYSECNRKLSNSKEYYSLRKYVSDELEYYKGSFWRNIFRFSTSQKINVEQKVSPKDDQHRYANSITLSPEQLLLMLIISKNITDNRSTNKDENVEQKIATTIYYLSRAKAKSEYKRSLIGYKVSEDNIHTIMFDQKLLNMEYIVRKILEKGVEENSEHKPFDKESKAEDNLKPQQLIENSNGKQLDRILHALTVISDVVDNIKVSCDPPCKRCQEKMIC